MSKEINQEMRFSASPQEAEGRTEHQPPGLHLNAEALANPERERVLAGTRASDVPAAQFATSDPRIVPLKVKAEDGGGLRFRALSGSDTDWQVVLDTLMFGAGGVVAGHLLSGGNPVVMFVGGVLGALFGAFLGWWTHRARR